MIILLCQKSQSNRLIGPLIHKLPYPELCPGDCMMPLAVQTSSGSLSSQTSWQNQSIAPDAWLLPHLILFLVWSKGQGVRVLVHHWHTCQILPKWPAMLSRPKFLQSQDPLFWNWCIAKHNIRAIVQTSVYNTLPLKVISKVSKVNIALRPYSISIWWAMVHASHLALVCLTHSLQT